MKVTIIADASHCSASGAAGYGWWTACERGKMGGGGQIKERIDGSGAAEMIAIVNAIHLSVKRTLIQEGDHLLLQTDCTAAIAAFNGSRLTMSKHEREAKKAFYKLKKEVKFNFTFRHVKGHSKRPEARFVTNNLCDMRAKKGMRLARARFGADEKGYPNE
jgi:ribonuclease HI